MILNNRIEQSEGVKKKNLKTSQHSQEHKQHPCVTTKQSLVRAIHISYCYNANIGRL